MKKVAIAVIGSVIMVVMGANSAQAQFETPSKVRAWGVYQHYVEPGWPDYFPSDDEEGLFTLSINPEAKGGRKSPQAVVWAVGRELRRFWGGAVLIRGDFDEWKPMVFDPSDPKPAQIFTFRRGQWPSTEALLRRQRAEGDVELKDARLEMPFRKDASRYFMGLHRQGGRRPERVKWH